MLCEGESTVLILVEAVNDSSNEDATCSSESDKEPSCDEEDESRRPVKTPYVHPKGKDKGGMCVSHCFSLAWLFFGVA